MLLLVEDLSKLYKLLKPISRGLQAMVTELEEHITKTGNAYNYYKNYLYLVKFSIKKSAHNHSK